MKRIGVMLIFNLIFGYLVVIDYCSYLVNNLIYDNTYINNDNNNNINNNDINNNNINIKYNELSDVFL